MVKSPLINLSSEELCNSQEETDLPQKVLYHGTLQSNEHHELFVYYYLYECGIFHLKCFSILERYRLVMDQLKSHGLFMYVKY